MIRKLITFTPRMAEMVEELQSVKGYGSFSAVVHASIAESHTKTFPNYLRPLAKDEDPAVKLRRKTIEKEAKQDIARLDNIEIVKALDGKVVVEGSKEFCVYYTYTGKKRFEQKIPLQMVSSDIVKTQYQPSREKVEKLQKEKKTDY